MRNKYIKEKRERMRESKNNQRPIWRTKKKEDKEKNSIRQSALIELHPFRLFSSLSLCLRQRSDQAESTISEAIILSGGGDREKYITSEHKKKTLSSDNKNKFISTIQQAYFAILYTQLYLEPLNEFY